MAKAKGFWSYVHADDAAEGGRITDLARDLAGQYEMLTGDTIQLFLDRDHIEWGVDWRQAIENSLENTAFFIPVLTPRYFASAECRRELNLFARHANKSNLADLVMPILYVDFPALLQDPSGDTAIDLVRPFQWIDWSELRFSSRASPEYRRMVAQMARRLADANLRADTRALGIVPEGAVSEAGPSDLPGTMDLIAQAEEVLPEWAATVEGIAADISAVGDLMEAATRRLNEPQVVTKGFAGRVIVMREVGAALNPLAEGIQRRADLFTSQLNSFDAGLMEMIPLLARTALEGSEEARQVCEFFDQVRTLESRGSKGLESFSIMIKESQPLEAMSRDLRAPLRVMRKGLTSMYESRKVMASWIQAIDASGLDCEATLQESLARGD